MASRFMIITTFVKPIEEIDNDLMHNKAFLLWDLLQRYKAYLLGNIEIETYRGFKLQTGLEKHYGPSISFYTQHGQGKSTCVLCSRPMAMLADAVQAAANLKQELKTFSDWTGDLLTSDTPEAVVHNAASIL